jgi:hypothetical protein
MTEPLSDAMPARDELAPELGSTWVVPGLVLAGLLVWGRLELLVGLVEAQGSAPMEWVHPPQR